MRRRLWKFLPIVLMALAVQIFAPIGACWAASIAASDPLHAAPICSGGAASTDQAGQTGGQRAHDGACAMCCMAQAAASLATPEASFTAPLRRFERVAWFDATPDWLASRAGWHAQARAPPTIS